MRAADSTWSKAMACFRLAKAGREPIANFTCAAYELNEGLALTSSWTLPANSYPSKKIFVNP